MITKEKAREKIERLVEDFKAIPKSHLDSMPEEDIKFQFIEPLLEALGWERKEITKETRVLKGRADYILRINNQEALVVEAKKTNVSLMEEEGRQAVSYAYHRKIKFAVLTNFKELRVYHALSNIQRIDKNLLKIKNDYFRLNFDEFLTKFDALWLLSRESFETGEINKLLSAKDEKLNKPIDASLLDDLLKIREWLSKDLKAKKNYLEKEQIDEIVQIIIDRLIFIRSVEDRNLEPINFLLGLDSDVRTQRVKLQLFPYLLEKFDEFNKKYDSKLFEKGLLEQEGAFSDDILHKVIRALYFGIEDNQAKYMFDIIPGDLFGSIYEQYLGTILAGTEKRVKLDSASGKRKKMGIYYTPSYIVDYIVKNTVGEYIREKSIDEILRVNIIDPACGSGSFLTRAFKEVCDRIELLLKEKKFGKIPFNSYSGKLTLQQEITILTNCIYGVDLDEKAVEMTRLNLLLNLLEGEGPETKKLLLPHLEQNIKNGNSLIDDPKVSDKAFNWHAQFKEVFADGGFDVVVGNPPYVFGGGTGISIKEKKFFSKNFASGKGKLNLFSLFIDQSISILKNKGFLSFILPNTILRVTSYEEVRKLILDQTVILKINDLPAGVFEGVTASTVIIVLRKDKDKDVLERNKIQIFDKLGDNLRLKQQKHFNQNLYIFDLGSVNSNEEILEKIKKNTLHLGSICKEMIFGVVITKNKSEIVFDKQINGKYKRFLEGKDIERYSINFSNKYLLYEKKKLHRARTPEIFEANEKILVQRISGGKRPLKAAYDNECFYNKESINNIILSDKRFNAKYILALLNSSLINWIYATKFTNFSMLTVNVSKAYLSQLPIHLPTPTQEQKIISLVNQMLSLQKKYHDPKTIGGEKERLKQQIENTDYEIDQEVYKLYNLTPEEIKIVEESLK